LTEDPFDREDLATLTKGKIGANALAVLLYLKNNASHDETGVSIRTVFDELSELTPQASGNVVSRLKQFGLVTLTGQLPGVRRIALTERGKKAIELLHGAIGNPVEAIG
jgi:hypothetical protein